MHKEYELWLDESGKFINESELKTNNKKPSLVGGFLLDRNVANTIPYATLIDNTRNHAMNLIPADKENYVLPILETMRTTYGAKQVIFENADYFDADSGRQLYLRILAEGLLQLMQQLNAKDESVELHVIIAQRQDMQASAGNRRILSAEYQSMLNTLIEKKKKEHRIFLHTNSKLSFQVTQAHLEHKLQLADFVCNTRLTRDTSAFANVRNRVQVLHDDAYIFTLSEVTSVNIISQSLADGYISDAIMELYTTKDALNHNEMLDLIMQRLDNTNYRLVKSQMKQCIADVTAYAAKEDDYEIGEAFLKAIAKELVPRLEAKSHPYQDLYFSVLIQLSDMYLREGDVLAADETLKECRKVQLSMGNSLENLFSYYQLLEKEALLAINKFDFEVGCELMKKASGIFVSLIDFVISDSVLSERFPVLKSEYYGDALCMQIYAMMFVQRLKPEIYEEMCNLSDKALQQYPKLEGELERHRQYRSHIELEKGEYESALLWLYKAKCYYEKEVSEQNMIQFLKEVYNTEVEVSRKYYLMYYLLIMCEAKLQGNELADMMYRALLEQKKMRELITGHGTNAINTGTYEIDMSTAQPDSAEIIYHPMEIVYWKYATYLNMADNELLAMKYYSKAVKSCFAHENYLTMYLTGLGIEAERISCLYKMKKNSEAAMELQNLKNRIAKLRNNKLPEGTEKFLDEFEKELQPNYDAVWKASRKVTY